MQKQIILVQEEPRGPSQLIEVPVNVNGIGRVNFPDIQQLRSTPSNDIVIKEIKLITVKALARGIYNDSPNAPLAELQKCALVVYCEGWEKAQFIPLLELNPFYDADGAAATTIPWTHGGKRFADWVNVDWSKSYIQYSNGTVSANSPYVFIFNVGYIRVNKQGQELLGPNT